MPDHPELFLSRQMLLPRSAHHIAYAIEIPQHRNTAALHGKLDIRLAEDVFRVVDIAVDVVLEGLLLHPISHLAVISRIVFAFAENFPICAICPSFPVSGDLESGDVRNALLCYGLAKDGMTPD